MRQLTQQLKSGKMEVLEVPFPVLGKGQVLVRNHYSVISAGTEGRTVRDARAGYLGKAIKRSNELRQVVQMARAQGVRTTYKLVMNKLEAPSSLGYSCAGEVLATGEGVTAFSIGDRVACGGASAVHAEVVSVPVNLCTPIPEGLTTAHAAFTTIAAIGIQGVRQAGLQFGESCVVIGLGLIGQICIQVLRASGINGIGIDIDPGQVESVNSQGYGQAYLRSQEGLEKHILKLTSGLGADAVIITAGSSSTDPVNLAGRLARRKGKVVIVGAVPTGFSRDQYYQKELELRMSCSYGPGRYDSTYEEKGIDYPPAYVRWTENRNMQSFLDLAAAGRINAAPLITHTFPLREAPTAYSMILEKSEPFAGILIEYPSADMPQRRIDIGHAGAGQGHRVMAGLIGAGSFAQNVLLPAFRGKVGFRGIVTGKGNKSLYIAEKYGFAFATDNPGEVLSDAEVNTLVIATRHDTHAKYVSEGIMAGKHVFVEKPLAMTAGEMKKIMDAYQAADARLVVMVGFNRRFAPFTREVRGLFTNDMTKAITIRVNAGSLPATHWVNDPETGGGRIIGEACHFIDLARYLAGASITKVAAFISRDLDNLMDTFTAMLSFSNGSVASLSYFSNGSKTMPKERIEVFCNGTTAVIDDFRILSIHGSRTRSRKAKQDKGHKAEVAAFIRAIEEGLPSPVPFDESWESSLATLAVIRSIASGVPIDVPAFGNEVLSAGE